MLKIKVNKEIILVKIRMKSASTIFKNVEKSREYLEEWLPWVHATRRVEDIRDFIRMVNRSDCMKKDLVMEISERLSLILENARLVETARRQVEREQLTSYISDQVRQSLDMDTVLKTAVQEIGQQLGLAEVELRLGDANPQSVKPTNGNRPQTSEEA